MRESSPISGLDELPPEVDGSPMGSTDVVSVTVRSEDPASRAALADAYVRAYTATRREQAIDSLSAAGEELQTKIDELQGQIDAADETQRAPLSPSKRRSRSASTSCRSTPPSQPGEPPSSSRPISRKTPSSLSRCDRQRSLV